MNTNLEVKVTRINNKWHCRLLENKKVIDEMACENTQDIGYICREVLRWYCKLGGDDIFAKKARERQQNEKGPIGKIWYKTQLDAKKSKIKKGE